MSEHSKDTETHNGDDRPRRRRLPGGPSVLIAVMLAAGATAWVMSGDMESQETTSQTAPLAVTAPSPANVPEDKAVAVRVRDSVAEPYRAHMRLTGKTEADRHAVLSAETVGRVVEIDVDLGDRVETGQTVARLAMDDRMARLREARALVTQREIEFNAADTLSKKGFQSETAKAQSRAQLEAAQAQLERIQVEISKTEITAPFAGRVEEKLVEVGDFAQTGTALLRLVDLDPMLVTVQVSEREIEAVEVGAEATVDLMSGQSLTGMVRRLAPSATAETRTFEVEIELPNPDFRLRDGVTASVRLPTRERLAHSLSPAVLTLDDAGRVGVKAVDADDKVVFHPVRILEDRADRMWVTGLPTTLTIITVGQEYVRVGATVRPMQDDVFEDANGPRIEADPIDADTPPRVSQGGDGDVGSAQ